MFGRSQASSLPTRSGTGMHRGRIGISFFNWYPHLPSGMYMLPSSARHLGFRDAIRFAHTLTGWFEVRACEQCGTEFTPRREHARFCSTGAAWPGTGATPGRRPCPCRPRLGVNAMIEVTSRLDGGSAADASDSPVTGPALSLVTLSLVALVASDPVTGPALSLVTLSLVAPCRWWQARQGRPPRRIFGTRPSR